MGRPLTIAHVDTERGFSGGQVQVFLLLEGLRRHGVTNLLCCRPGSAEQRRAESLGIATAPVPMANDLHLSAVPRLAWAFGRAGADLVHLHTGRANWLGGWAARFCGLPAITTRRMDRPLHRGLATRLVYGSLVARAVAISPAVASILREAGVDEQRIVTIGSTVDPSALVPRRARAELRAELGVGDEQQLLLGVARLTRRKGFDVLLSALAEMAHDPRWSCVLAGDGPERQPLLRRAADLGLEHRVRLPGLRDDVPDLLAACDLFVMPSRAEGLGVAALEAMAAGRPVLASAVGGLADAVLPERTGLLVPPDQPRALADALRRLLDDADLRRRLGDQGPAHIAEHYAAATMVERYLALYRQVLAERD